jgi:hypothetical protein
MDIKTILKEFGNLGTVATLGYNHIYIAAIVAVLITIAKLWHSFKLRASPLEDVQDYYENGGLKKSFKRYRQ